jgi:hypothetical protein
VSQADFLLFFHPTLTWTSLFGIVANHIQNSFMPIRASRGLVWLELRDFLTGFHRRAVGVSGFKGRSVKGEWNGGSQGAEAFGSDFQLETPRLSPYIQN